MYLEATFPLKISRPFDFTCAIILNGACRPDGLTQQFGLSLDAKGQIS
jgi:hypothetical protein